MTIMNEDGTEIFVLMDCARCELAGRNPCDLNKCPRGLSECVPSSCLYYTEEWSKGKRKGTKANSMYYVFFTDGIERTCGYISSDYNNANVILHEMIDELSMSGARGCILNDKLEVVYKTGGFVNDSKGRSNRTDKT